ncbi:MAG: sugar ABC transporter permease [Clostridiales bacterium]|nr:sugar ABC transporter permease [Clostridiales bacterium]
MEGRFGPGYASARVGLSAFDRGVAVGLRNRSLEKYYHLMLAPAVLLVLLYSIVPMFGIVIAFQKFVPAKGIFGSKFVGIQNFNLLLMYPDVRKVVLNTVVIAVSKIALGLIVPVSFAVLLNEIRWTTFRRTVQTIVYMPNFLSWVILAIMFNNIFSYTGMINSITKVFGAQPIMFLVSNAFFRPIIVGTDVWKNFGYGAVIYLAAITNIDQNIYEAAAIDGANRWQKITRVVLPSISSTIILMATLSLGNVLNAGFDQVYNMYTPLVYETGDIIDTYVYRMGLEKMQYSFGTAVGLAKSVVSFVLLSVSYKLAERYAGYTLF